MTDYIRLQHGESPWGGSAGLVSHVETYHRYDIPLIGLVKQAGGTYLFRCFVGEAESINVWSYTLVEPTEVDRLDDVEGSEFDALVEELSARPGVVGIAIDGYGIVDSVEVESWTDLGSYGPYLVAAVQAFMQRLDTDLATQQRRLAPAG